MQIRMHISKEDAVVQCTFGLTDLDPGRVGFLRAGHATADQHQVAAWLDGAAAQQRDGGPLDHDVAGQHPGGDAVEFQ